MRGATSGTDVFKKSGTISIHTPHAGSDSSPITNDPDTTDFNPHSPCGERPFAMFLALCTENFNPHSPCGERLTGIGTWWDGI